MKRSIREVLKSRSRVTTTDQLRQNPLSTTQQPVETPQFKDLLGPPAVHEKYLCGMYSLAAVRELMRNDKIPGVIHIPTGRTLSANGTRTRDSVKLGIPEAKLLAWLNGMQATSRRETPVERITRVSQLQQVMPITKAKSMLKPLELSVKEGLSLSAIRTACFKVLLRRAC